MPLPTAESRTPESIADLIVVLTDYIEDGDQEARQEGRFEVQVVYNNGEIKLIQGDLVPHLTGPQKTALLGFLATLRTKAEQEILP